MQADASVSGEDCPSCGRNDVGDSRFCYWCGQLLVGPTGFTLATFGQRFAAYLLDGILIFLTLFIGYLIWWLIVLDRGQTPGKQVVGIQVIKDNGEPSDWGYTFLREFVIKGILVGIISMLTLYIFWLVDGIWAAWDKDKQTLHDKIVGTLVVQVERTVAEA